MANSRNYTLGTLIGLIRLKATNPQSRSLIKKLLIDIIYTSLLDVARELGEADTPEFGTKVELLDIIISPSRLSFDLTDIDGAGTKINVESIIKIIGLTSDDEQMVAIPTDVIEYDYLADYPQKQNNVYWYREGETVYFYIGNSMTSYEEMKLYYNRIPEKAILDATYIDLSDRFMPLLIEKVLEKISV